MTPEPQALPHITRLEGTASERFIAQALTMRILAVHGAFEYDIDGALGAGQYGLAFVATRGALHLALCAYLAQQGFIRSLPDLREPAGGVFELLAAREADTELWREAWTLECANPDSPEDIVRYVERYRRFFQRTLNFQGHRSSSALLSDAVYDDYLQQTDDLSRVLKHLGIGGILLPDVQARVSQRAAVKQRLANVEGAASGQRAETHDPEPAALAKGEPSVDIRVTLGIGALRVVERVLAEQIAALRTESSRTVGRDERRDLLLREQACEKLLDQLRTQPGPLHPSSCGHEPSAPPVHCVHAPAQG